MEPGTSNKGANLIITPRKHIPLNRIFRIKLLRIIAVTET